MTRTLRGFLALLLSVVWVTAAAGSASAGGGGGCHGEFADEATDEIKVAMNCYLPAVARVDVGDKVTWFSGENEAPHTVTGVNDVFIAGSGDLPPGGRQSATFDRAGVYPYACLLHPGMVGAIVVGEGGGGVKSSAAAPAAPPAAPPPAPLAEEPADRAPATEPTSASRTPVAVGAGVLLLIVVGVLAARRSGRATTAVPPTVPAP